MRLLIFTGVRTHGFTYRAYKYAGLVNLGCVPAGKDKRNYVTRVLLFLRTFLSFLEFDMRSRGIRLGKEDSMTVDGAIPTANRHGDKF